MERSANQILEHATTGIIVLDDQLCIQYLNESAQALFEESIKRLRGVSLDRLFRHSGSDQDQQADLLGCCQRVLETGQSLRVIEHETSLRTSATVLRFDCEITPMELRTSRQLLLELFTREESLARHAVHQADNSSQLLVRSLAHEIRNPLGGIRGAEQLLAGELADGTYDEYLEVVIREVDRLERLVSRMQASGVVGEKQPLNIHTVLEHVRKLVTGQMDGAVEPETDYDPSLPDIVGDHDQLVQVFLNLLQNAQTAVDSRMEEGRIVLRSRIDKQLLPGGHVPEQVVRVDIEDNGCGVPPELIDRVFEPLMSGTQTGTGLGLSISREIVTNHHGLIDISSDGGKTTVSVYLKIAGAEYAA